MSAAPAAAARIIGIGIRAGTPTATAIADAIVRIAVGDAGAITPAPTATAVADRISRIAIGDAGAIAATTAAATADRIGRIAIGDAGAAATAMASTTTRIIGITVGALCLSFGRAADEDDGADYGTSENLAQERASGNSPNFVTHSASPRDT